MTKEQAIEIIELDRKNSISHGFNKDLQEAPRIAIEALRGECPGCSGWNESYGLLLKTNSDLVDQIESAEEALKALERERDHDPWWGQQQCDVCDDRVKAADAEIAWKCNDETQSENVRLRAEINSLKTNGAVSALGMCPRCEDLKTELAAEREKVEKLRVWLTAGPVEPGGISFIAAYEAKPISDLFFQLWPDPAPEPKTLDEKIEQACNKYPDLRELFEE